METPNFKGVELYDRLCWAAENLKPYKTDYRVVFEDQNEKCAVIMIPDPMWMACAIQGGIHQPAWVWWELEKDEAQPNFTEHHRLHLITDTEPVAAMTEEEAIEHLIQINISSTVWKNLSDSNRVRLVICREDQLPKNNDFRDAWQIKQAA